MWPMYQNLDVFLFFKTLAHFLFDSNGRLRELLISMHANLTTSLTSDVQNFFISSYMRYFLYSTQTTYYPFLSFTLHLHRAENYTTILNSICSPKGTRFVLLTLIESSMHFVWVALRKKGWIGILMCDADIKTTINFNFVC